MILIVEDDEMMRGILEIFLKDKGYQVLAVQDGREAVNAYKEFGGSIRIVISDLEMPHLNGVDMYRQLKEMNPDVKVVLASGYLDPRLQHQLQCEGARYFLNKPYTPDEVLEKIGEALGKV